MDFEELLSHVDIVEYISQFVDLHESNGEFWGLSPFKEEKTPSFSVSSEKQVYYDFSSGGGGNCIEFIKKYHKCNYSQAVKILKKHANISESEDVKPVVRLEATKIAKRFLKKDKHIKENCAKKLPNDYMEQYEFDVEKLKMWELEGIPFETMKKFEVRYDSFSNRIVFPIKTYEGVIVNVCGRTLDEKYKEKGLRKYTYFKPWGGCLDTLYGFSENRQSIIEKKEVIVFEGSKSVMLADSWGITNSVCALTSHLNPKQMLFLVKLGVRVVFAFDEDVDISQDDNIQKLKHYVNVEWVKNRDGLLKSKMSPVDAGFEVWNYLYERRVAYK